MIFSESQNILLPYLVWWWWARVSCRNFCCSCQWGLIWSKYDSFCYIFWTVDFLATKLGLMICHHKPECPVEKTGLPHSGSRSQWRVKMLMFVQMICSKPSSILFPNLVCIIVQELIWSKYDNVFCIFWTADPFATKLGLIVHYHKPECFMEKLDCFVQGQGHSKISKCEWMFVQVISSENLNLLLPNLARCCIIMSPIVYLKDWFAVFKVKVTVKNIIIKVLLFDILSELLTFFQLNLVW